MIPWLAYLLLQGVLLRVEVLPVRGEARVRIGVAVRVVARHMLPLERERDGERGGLVFCCFAYRAREREEGEGWVFS